MSTTQLRINHASAYSNTEQKILKALHEHSLRGLTAHEIAKTLWGHETALPAFVIMRRMERFGVVECAKGWGQSAFELRWKLTKDKGWGTAATL